MAIPIIAADRADSPVPRFEKFGSIQGAGDLQPDAPKAAADSVALSNAIHVARGRSMPSFAAEGLALVTAAVAAAPAMAAEAGFEALVGPIGIRGALYGTLTGAASAGLVATKIVLSDKQLGVKLKTLIAASATVAGALAGGVGGIAGGWFLGSVCGSLSGALTGVGLEEEIVQILKENKEEAAAGLGHVLGQLTGRLFGRRVTRREADVDWTTPKELTTERLREVVHDEIQNVLRQGRPLEPKGHLIAQYRKLEKKLGTAPVPDNVLNEETHEQLRDHIADSEAKWKNWKELIQTAEANKIKLRMDDLLRNPGNKTKAEAGVEIVKEIRYYDPAVCEQARIGQIQDHFNDYLDGNEKPLKKMLTIAKGEHVAEQAREKRAKSGEGIVHSCSALIIVSTLSALTDDILKLIEIVGVAPEK